MWAEREGRLHHRVLFCKDKDGIEGLILEEKREWWRFSVYLFLCPAQLCVHRKCFLVLEAGILGKVVRKKVGEGLCESFWMGFKEERETAAGFLLQNLGWDCGYRHRRRDSICLHQPTCGPCRRSPWVSMSYLLDWKKITYIQLFFIIIWWTSMLLFHTVKEQTVFLVKFSTKMSQEVARNQKWFEQT